MPDIVIRTEDIESIAARCQTSSQNIQSEATTMQQQITALREALSGIPNLAIADRLDEWQQLLNKLSTSLQDSQQYLHGVLQAVDDFVAGLGRR
jgi:WXG100 family type VII secretion target